MWVDVGRCGSMWADVGRCGSVWVGVGRRGSVWVDVGRCGSSRAAAHGTIVLCMIMVGSSSQANYLLRNSAMDDSIGGS